MADARYGGFQKASFLLYLLVVTGAFLLLLRHFLLTTFMAAVFTALTYPAYLWMVTHTKRPFLASLLTLWGLVLMLVLPLTAVGIIAYQEAMDILLGLDLNAIRRQLEGLVREFQAEYPLILQRFSPEELTRAAFGWLQNLSQIILRSGATIGFTVMNQIFSFFLMLFMMFYFYVDGPRLLQLLIRWSPLKDEYERILISRFLSVSKGTLKGILFIGVIQGAIGTSLFFFTGVGSPVFLGVLMVFASVIPAVGAGLIWFPAAIILLFQGRWLAGIAVILVGALVISSVDNVLRPVIVGKDIKMHDLLVLLSTLGGLTMFGLAGFIIGPVIAALFVSIWHIFEEVFEKELALNRERNAPPPSPAGPA